MNPRPVILALCCAVLFVIGVYYIGQYVLEQGHLEEFKPPVVSKTKRSEVKVDNSVDGNNKTISDISPTNIADEPQTDDSPSTPPPVPPAGTEASNTVEVAEKPQNTSVDESPHGFGPYPSIPDDYPWDISWETTHDNPKQELLDRVQIKLWKQGIHTDGVGYGPGGKIYPVVSGTVYITWKNDEIRGRYISMIDFHPDDDFLTIKKTLEAGETPDGITVLEHDSSGIEPYTFLKLSIR